MVAKIKPLCGTNRTQLSKVLPLDTPFSVYVYPTNKCNFNCSYCAHSMSSKELKERYSFKKDTMSLETYKRVINQLTKFPEQIKLLSLTGVGEPLLHKDIAEMVKIAKDTKKFKSVEFISNGSLLTPALSDKLIDAGLDTLRISLQGLSSQKYKDICGANINFDEFMNNIRYFYANKKRTGLFVKVLDIALDKNEEDKFYSLFENCSDRMFIEKVQPTYSGVELTDKIGTTTDRYGKQIKQRKVCPLPFFMLGVFPNGDVQPCDNLYRPVILGNIHQKSIDNMWESKKLKDFWRLQLKGDRLTHPKCSLCCAPDDVSQPEDILDNDAEMLLERLK